MKSFLLGTTMLTASCAFSQTVPDTVKHVFAKKYQGVSGEIWTTGQNTYTVRFVKEKRPVSVIFTENGTLLETRTALIANDLPYKITNYIETKHDGSHILSAALIVKGKKKTYEVEINSNKLLFDEVGKCLTE